MRAGTVRGFLRRAAWSGGLLWLIGCAGAARAQVDATSGATRPGQSVVGSVTSDYELLDQPRPRAAELDAEAVFILTRWSNQLSYGLANVAPPGTASVLLVPTVAADAITDARMLRAVIRLCAEVLPQPALTIGIPPGAEIPAAYRVLAEELSGFVDIRLVLLEDEPLRSLPAVTSLLRPAYELPEPVALADAVIVVPALRRDSAGAVLGTLDAVAALSPGPATGDSARVDLISAVAPLYVFADLLRPGVGGERRALNAILASDDPCAVDAVGAQLLGGRPADVPALRLAAQHEVGKDKWIDIAINGVPIPRRGSRSHPAEE